MRQIRVLIYWLSVLPPVLDALRGLVTGIKKGLEDVRTRAADEEAMRKKFEEANKGS